MPRQTRSTRLLLNYMYARRGVHFDPQAACLFLSLSVFTVLPAEVYPTTHFLGTSLLLLTVLLFPVIRESLGHRARTILGLLLGLIVLSLLSVLRSPSPLSSIRFGSLIAVMALSLLLGTRIGRHPGGIAAFGIWMFVLALFHAAFAVGQSLSGLEQSVEQLQGVPETIRDLVSTRLSEARAFSLFSLPSHLSLLLAMAIPFTLALSLRAKSLLTRIVFTGGLLFIAVAFLLSGSFSGVFALGAAAAAGFLPLRDSGKSSKARFRLSQLRGRWWWTAVLITVILGTAILFTARKAALDFTDPGHPLELRMRNARASLEIIGDQPLLGVGAGNFGTVYPQYRRPGDNETRYSHNSYLQLGAELGLPGLFIGLSLAGLCIAGLRRSAAQESRPGHRMLKVAAASACAAYFAQNLLGFTFYLESLGMVVFALVGVSLGRRGKPERAQAPAWAYRGLAIPPIVLGIVLLGAEYRAEISLQKAQSALTEDRTEKAVSAASVAQRSFPWDARFSQALSATYLARKWQGDDDRALIWARDAVKLEPREAGYRKWLASVLESSGNLPLAWVQYRQAQNLHPADREAAAKSEEILALLRETETTRDRDPAGVPR